MVVPVLPRVAYMDARPLPGQDPRRWRLLGLPYDGTASFKKGSRHGPDAVRRTSDGLESYFPVLNRSLTDIPFHDEGDLPPLGDTPDAVMRAYMRDVALLAAQGGRLLCLGGEHSVSYAPIAAAASAYPDLVVVHFDAHADLRPHYEGERWSHASVMRRVVELLGPDRLRQIGVRSGTAEEWDFMRRHHTVVEPTAAALNRLATELKDTPVYLTIDLDVLDPSAMPGTGTPEPGGLSYRELQDGLLTLRPLNVVGADVVELAPELDPSGISSITAAAVVRLLLLGW